MRIADLEIKGVTSNSKEVKKGFIFVAIKGNCQNGNLFIQEAITRGASVVVAEHRLPRIRVSKKVIYLAVDDCRRFFAQVTSKFYGDPSKKVKVVGITGTNGKTTIAYLIEALAKKSGYTCGVIGTINYRFGSKIITAKNTTPGAGQLQGLLKQMQQKKVKYCAMEVSSHALDQERTGGINFSRAIFTNLTQDHLDYHKNLENYFLAKAKLFTTLVPGAIAILNNDDPYSRRIKRLTKAKVLTYGIKNKSEIMAKDIDFGMRWTEFSLVFARVSLRIKTKLIGRHNIYNILAASAWGVSEHLPLSKIKEALEEFSGAPGRLQRINSAQGFNIFVDYAHTPDALFNVLSALKPLVEGKIILIFGCGGDRDKLKRPLMGKVAVELADFTVLTSDNPRSENAGRIIQDITAGIKKSNYCIVAPRAKAIAKGLSLIGKNDCLLIAGKGHENYQIVKNKVMPFSDEKAVRKCLALMR